MAHFQNTEIPLCYVTKIITVLIKNRDTTISYANLTKLIFVCFYLCQIVIKHDTNHNVKGHLKVLTQEVVDILSPLWSDLQNNQFKYSYVNILGRNISCKNLTKWYCMQTAPAVEYRYQATPTAATSHVASLFPLVTLLATLTMHTIPGLSQ